LTATRGGVSHDSRVSLEVARKPIVELSPATLPPVLMGEEFLLGWRAFNADALEVVDEKGTIRCTASTQASIEEGLCSLREDEAGRHRYTVRATGAHGAVGEYIATVDVYG